MGATHFLTRTLDKVRTEMSLHVLAYDLKRMIAIFGAGPLTVELCRIMGDEAVRRRVLRGFQ
jgi:hypothetical protein